MSNKSKLSTILFLGSLFLFLSFNACTSSESIRSVKKKNIEINKDIQGDTSVSTIISPYKDDLDKKMNEVLNTSDVDLTIGSPESNLGNLMTDLCYEVASSMYFPTDSNKIDFCLFTVGGFRASISKGPIKLGKVFEVMPFENELVIITLSYDKVIELFDYIAINGGEPLSHAQMKIKDNKAIAIKVNGMDLDPKRNYKVVTSDYLARGGDNMVFFSDPINYELAGIKLREAIILYFKQEAEAGRSISSSIEGRVSYE